MKKVTITELKDNLSALLARAARGEEIIVFDRKKPYVRLVALFKYGSSVGDKTKERLQRLEVDGLVSRRQCDSIKSYIKRKRPRSAVSVVDALIEERDRDR